MTIKRTVDAARAAGYRYSSKKPFSEQPGGENFEPKDIGDICYTGPCVNGEREIYYFSEEGCTDGPYYTSEGCDG